MKKTILTALSLLLVLPVLTACTIRLGGDAPGVPTDENGSRIPAPPGGDLPPDPPGTAQEAETADLSQMDFDFSDRDLDGSFDPAGAVRITFSASSAAVSGAGASADGTAVTVTAAGTYLLSGTCPSGSVTIRAGENDKVRLILDSLSLACPAGPAIFAESADKVFLTLAEGSVNSLSDAAPAAAADGGSVPDGAVFSRCDLTVNGSGALTVTGAAKHGIVSKDDLIITGGTLTVRAAGAALCGKDCVKIAGGTLSLDAGTDGIRSDNTEDAARGYIFIRGGTVGITAGNDALQAQTALNITGGVFTLRTGSGSAAARQPGSAFGGPGRGGSSAADEESRKGLKAGAAVIVSGGTFTVDSEDDCIHSNGTVELSGGSFSLSSGDDGIHADSQLTVSGGDLRIIRSYEGLESSNILISDGKICVAASDDGINISGGADSSAMGRPGMGGFSAASGTLTISGGYTVINASGDGLDSNGSIVVTGGVTLVSGPADNGNGALDYDGSASVSGGVLIALGSSGMAQGFRAAENQGAILCNFTAQSAGQIFAVCDASGRVVASFRSPKSFSSAVVTAPGIRSGETYTLRYGISAGGADENGYAAGASCTGGTVLAEIQMTSALYSSGGQQNPGGPGGPGEDPGGRPGKPGRF